MQRQQSLVVFTEPRTTLNLITAKLWSADTFSELLSERKVPKNDYDSWRSERTSELISRSQASSTLSFVPCATFRLKYIFQKLIPFFNKALALIFNQHFCIFSLWCAGALGVLFAFDIRTVAMSRVFARLSSLISGEFR
jgi:hypothetical protein